MVVSSPPKSHLPYLRVLKAGVTQGETTRGERRGGGIDMVGLAGVAPGGKLASSLLVTGGGGVRLDAAKTAALEKLGFKRS